jgi:hypothetical protein
MSPYEEDSHHIGGQCGSWHKRQERNDTVAATYRGKASKTTRQFVPIGQKSELINRSGMKTLGWRNFTFSYLDEKMD